MDKVGIRFVLIGAVAVAGCGDNDRPGIEVDRDAVSLPAGAAADVGVSVHGAGSFGTSSPKDLAWTIDDPSIASVVATGSGVHIVGQAVGSTAAHVDYFGIDDTVAIDVTAADLVNVAIQPGAIALPVGLSVPTSLVATYTDGSTADVTSSATWTVDASAVAAWSAGKLWAIGVGSAVLSASVDGVEASAPVTVSGAAVMAVAVSPAISAIPAGVDETLAAIAQMSDGTSLDVSAAATWSSDATSVATCTGNVVHGVGAGSAGITATLPGAHAGAQVVVDGATVVALAIDPAIVVLPKGTSQALVATAVFSDGSKRDVTADVTWSSSAQAVASAAGGVVVGVAPGLAAITASEGGVTAVAATTVTAATVTSIAVTAASQTLASGTSEPLTATASFSDGTIADVTAEARWTSDRIASVLVAPAGVATAALPGVANVTASLGGASGSAAITATSATLVQLAITPSSLALTGGATRTVTATATYSDHSTQDVTAFAVWTTADPLVATALPGIGVETVTGIAAGSTVLSARVGTLSATAPVGVSAATVTAIVIAPVAPSVPLGTTAQLTATAQLSDGSQVDVTAQAQWIAALPLVASVSNAAASAGVVTPHVVGVSLVTAVFGGVSASVPVTVTAAALQSIAVGPASVSVPVGLGAALVAIGHYGDGSQIDLTAQVVWTSSAPSVCSVSNALLAHGVVAGHAVGSATVTATLGTVGGSAAVTVTPAALVSIAVRAPVVSLAAGLSVQLVATGTLSDATLLDLGAQASWSSSAPAIVSVSNAPGTRGLITAVAAGQATITVAVGAVTATIDITVTPAVLSSISLLPGLVQLPVGLSIAVVATGALTDGSHEDVTQLATWSCGQPSIAAVANLGAVIGLVTGKSVGATTLTAQVGAISATIDVDVTVGL